jgi:hypothetical protein
MSGVFQNVDPSPPFGAGGGHTRWVERGWGSIFWKTPNTALYSTYVGTLCTVQYTRFSQPVYIHVSAIYFIHYTRFNPPYNIHSIQASASHTLHTLQPAIHLHNARVSQPYTIHASASHIHTIHTSFSQSYIIDTSVSYTLSQTAQHKYGV